jgi:hypothetical protein
MSVKELQDVEDDAAVPESAQPTPTPLAQAQARLRQAQDQLKAVREREAQRVVEWRGVQQDIEHAKRTGDVDRLEALLVREEALRILGHGPSAELRAAEAGVVEARGAVQAVYQQAYPLVERLQAATGQASRLRVAVSRAQRDLTQAEAQLRLIEAEVERLRQALQALGVPEPR